MSFKNAASLTVILSLVACVSAVVVSPPSKPTRLYWFVPDGLRADPQVFNIYEWARQGKLPNLKRMMDEGSYGFSIPVFPSHTPVNFAALFTGVLPKRNGVSDGPIRVYGHPLRTASRSGFSSLAKLLDPFWVTTEKAGKLVTLLSIPGSTPPDIQRGNVIRGRWGGWGRDFPNLIFQSADNQEFRRQMGLNAKVFQVANPLTEFIHARPPGGWQMALPSGPLREIEMANPEGHLFGLLDQSSVYLSLDKKTVLFHLRQGEWSPWFTLTTVHGPLQAKVKAIKISARDFRLRVLYDALNSTLVQPASLSDRLRADVGPMVDFVDNFPPQLIYYPEDKATFLEESELSFDWHSKAEAYFLGKGNQDVLIQSIYSPNQMLTSRWWMAYLDPHASRYKDIGENERSERWKEVLHMYQRIDDMLGEALKRRSPDSYVVFSSDHGVAPLNFEVRLNNLFAGRGWLTYRVDRESQIPQVDWAKTRVVYLGMNNVYINPRGLGGDYQPAHGAAYEELCSAVSKELTQLQDEHGIFPLAKVQRREEVEAWGLPAKQVGDLIIANRSGYNWIEDITQDHVVFAPALKAGYKQAILPDEEPALWTPFVIVGPGIKAGHELSRPIHHLEQYPTVMRALRQTSPYTPDAAALEEIFINEVLKK